MQVVETLSKLNLDLLRHALTIPPHAGTPPDISQDDEQFNLDDTLRLTSIFIETVKPLHFPGSSSSSNSSLCIHHHHHHHHQPDEVVVVMVDTASVFLVMSCWHRLADIHDEIIVLTRGYAEQTLLPASKTGRLVTLPSVRRRRFCCRW